MKSVFYSVVHFLFKWPARLLFRVKVIGGENEPKKEAGPYIVCANHQSMMDPVFICIATKYQQPHFMGKAELIKTPLVGGLLRSLGAYPVSRGRADVGAVKKTLSLLENGASVGMFPQGTRCPDQNPADCPIKYGVGMIAAKSGAQVLPIHIKMKQYHWKFFRRVTVVVGKPIPAAQLAYQPEAAGEYIRIANEIYREICRLGETVRG